jgi:cysteine synthase A
MKKIITEVTSLIGNTPLLFLDYDIPNTKILVKFEAHNLTGSVKDRMALYMLKKARKMGKIKKGGTIIEATTGNTGIAFAALAKVFGYKMIAVIIEGQSAERIKMIKSYGATVIETPIEKGVIGSVRERDRLLKITPNAWTPSQFSNPDNTKEHIAGIAPEIFKQLGKKKVDYIVHGIGTGGTLMGLSLYFKKKFPKVKIIAIEPKESAVLSGGRPMHHNIQGIGEGFIPDIVDKNLIDEVVQIETKEAIDETKQLIDRTGLFVGFSSGANLAAIRKIAAKDKKRKTILTIFADRGERYLSVE